MLPTLAILLALGAAITALVAGVKAAPLVPSYADKFKSVDRELTAVLRTTYQIAGFMRKEIGGTGKLPGTEGASSALFDKTDEVAAVLEEAHERVKTGALLDFNDEAEAAAAVRLWLIGSAVLASASAACQLIGLVVQAGPDS